MKSNAKSSRRRQGPASAQGRKKAARLCVGGFFLLLIAGAPGLRAQTLEPERSEPAASDPAPRLEQHRVASPNFDAPKPMVVYLPPGFDASPDSPYPVLYFLHGLGNSPNDFESRGAAALTDRLIREGRVPPVVIALPSGAVSYYVNRKDGGAPYEDHVRLEAPAYVEAHYPVRKEREGRALSGISMGGFGALKIAMRYPGEFGSASAHTPFLMKEIPEGEATDRTSRMFMRVMRTLYGDPIDEAMWRANNPFSLAQTAGAGLPPLLFTAASQDRYGLQVPARVFHEELAAEEIPHVYIPFEGVHGWKSFESHWEAMLRFHARVWEAAGHAIP